MPIGMQVSVKARGRIALMDTKCKKHGGGAIPYALGNEYLFAD